jgi:HTH domain
MDTTLDEYAEVFRAAVTKMEIEKAVPTIGAIKPKRDLGRIGLRCFTAIVSMERFELLKVLRRKGPVSVSGLAHLLKRSEKAVQRDVAILLKSALLSRTESGLVEVTWDDVTAELDLLAA